ncbi:MAG: hypothetical protein KGN02_01135 [bacterium]|nr:hypothetical protein [bacterium]
MDFESLDRYLLDGAPEKGELIRSLLAAPQPPAAARAFVEGMRMLGPRTPDLTLIALRLVLAGKPAADDRVVALRGIVERARRGGEDGERARGEYRAALRDGE